jgi:hypothetical protein
MNGSLFSVVPFRTFIVFDLGNAAVGGTGGRYGRGLPVPVSAIAPGTDFLTLVDFDASMTRLSSVIAGPFA